MLKVYPLFFPYGKPDGWNDNLRHHITTESTDDLTRVGVVEQGKKVSRAEFVSYHLFPRHALQDGFNGISNVNCLIV